MSDDTTQRAAVWPDATAPKVVAYLYHDAQTAADAHPWLHSTMLVMAADRRQTLRNETPLVTLAQARAMVAAERERCARMCEEYADPADGPDAAADTRMVADALAARLRGPNAHISWAPGLPGDSA